MIRFLSLMLSLSLFFGAPALAKKVAPIRISLKLQSSYEHWKRGSIVVSLTNIAPTDVLLVGLQLKSGSWKMTRNKFSTLKLKKSGDDFVHRVQLRMEKIGRTEARQPRPILVEAGKHPGTKLLFLKRGARLSESWKPRMTTQMGSELSVTVRYIRMDQLGKPTYLPTKGKRPGTLYRRAKKGPGSSRYVLIPARLSDLRNAFREQTVSLPLTIKRPKPGLEQAKKAAGLSGRVRFSWWIAEKLWVFSNGRHSVLVGKSKPRRVDGDLIRLVDRFNDTAKPQPVDLAQPLLKKRERAFLKRLGKLGLEPKFHRFKWGPTYRFGLSSEKLFSLIKLLKRRKLMLRGNEIKAIPKSK